MNKVMRKLQDKTGYISIELIIVAGLMTALGAWAWVKFYAMGETVIDSAINSVDSVENVVTSSN